MKAGLAPDNGTILTYVWIVVALGAAAAALIYYAFGLIRKILKPMTEGCPFDLSVGENLKKIGYVSLVLGVVKNVGTMLETAATFKAFDLAELASDGAIRFSTLEAICDVLDCQPGDILEFVREEKES